MPADDKDGSSSAFMQLRRLARSFDGASALGRLQERTIRRLVIQLGATAIPLCVRELGSSVEGRARLAYQLLGHLGAASAHKPRVVAALEQLAQTTGLGDVSKLRALALLTELGCEAPAGTRFDDASMTRERSLRELAGYLSSLPDIARAGDILVSKMSGEDMLALVDALSIKEPRRAIPLLSELLLRNDLDERARGELRRIRAPLRDRYGDRLQPPAGGQPVATATMGRHGSGRRVIVASRRIPGSRPSQHRALCVLIAPDGAMLDGLYREDFAPDGVEREVLRMLRSQGYRFESVSQTIAADVVIRAAQASRHLGKALPRAFYLGRDLIGIYHEHAAGVGVQDDDIGALLERGRGLMDAGELARARPVLERYVTQMPECADGCASLAMCLIGLGEVSAARPHLRRAAWLQPGNPNHSWNLAAVAHREGRVGACYLALVDYLEHAGEFDEAPGDSEERRRIAGAFTAEYERIARLEHPDAGPEAVAHADDLVHRAMLRVQLGQGPEAICVLEQALSFVPTHYQAMAYLGMAHAERHELEEASRYLDRALAVRPGYPLALEARERLLGSSSMPPRRAAPRRRSSPRKSRAGKKPGS